MIHRLLEIANITRVGDLVLNLESHHILKMFTQNTVQAASDIEDWLERKEEKMEELKINSVKKWTHQRKMRKLMKYKVTL